MSKPVTVTVLHNIFLSKEQRYALADGQSLECIGVSVPVWFNKGKTNEPGKEVFCKYLIHNRPIPQPVKILDEGYEINLPQENEKMLKVVDPKETNSLIGETAIPPLAKNLKDIKDGGCAFLAFKQYTKVTKEKRTYNMLHFIEIKDMEVLEKTMCNCEET